MNKRVPTEAMLEPRQYGIKRSSSHLLLCYPGTRAHEQVDIIELSDSSGPPNLKNLHKKDTPNWSIAPTFLSIAYFFVCIPFFSSLFVQETIRHHFVGCGDCIGTSLFILLNIISFWVLRLGMSKLKDFFSLNLSKIVLVHFNWIA